MDGITVFGNEEDTLMVLVHCFKNEAIEEISSHTKYLSLYNPQRADASGLLHCIVEATKLFGVDTVLNQDSVLRIEDGTTVYHHVCYQTNTTFVFF